MEHYLSLAISSIFVQNILLALFLGMCSFLAVSKRIDTAMGLGAAVIFVLSFTCPINWFIYHFFLEKGALRWAGLPGVDLSFLSFVTFISVIAAFVQFVEMFIAKYSARLQASLGIFLPLITVNCAILGGSLFMMERDYNFPETVVFGISCALGWALAITAMAAIRQKLRYSNIPPALRGLGIAMLLTGLMAMAFMCFAGISL